MCAIIRFKELLQEHISSVMSKIKPNESIKASKFGLFTDGEFAKMSSYYNNYLCYDKDTKTKSEAILTSIYDELKEDYSNVIGILTISSPDGLNLKTVLGDIKVKSNTVLVIGDRVLDFTTSLRNITLREYIRELYKTNSILSIIDDITRFNITLEDCNLLNTALYYKMVQEGVSKETFDYYN